MSTIAEPQEHETSDQTCFVIGPIGSQHAPIGTEARSVWEDGIQLWEAVLEPACAQFGLSPVRADKLFQPGEINEQIFVLLRDADVVIADLSGGNSNVMYELGLRHTRNKITIQIGQYERLPFDVNTIRTIQFKRTDAGLIDARVRLTEALGAALGGSFSPVTATRVWEEGAPLDQAQLNAASIQSAQPDDDPVEEDEVGFMDILAEGELAMQQIAENIERASELTLQLGDLGTAAAQSAADADAQGGGFVARLNVARVLADGFEAPARELDTLSAEYVSLVAAADLGVEYLIQQIERDPSQLEDARETFASIVALSDSVDGAAVGLTGFVHEVRQLKKIARVLQAPARSLERSVGRYVTSAEVFNRWKTRVESLPGWEVPES